MDLPLTLADLWLKLISTSRCSKLLRWSAIMRDRINNKRNMKGKAYALVEAHVVGCRLHHHNSLLYSVGLKTGKDLTVSTEFLPSAALAIAVDQRFTVSVDKHSYEQFPKFTLIVNVMAENRETKTVGTTFANFRKQGLQTLQVSECSCKDKAFEVDIRFTSKLVDPKSSNNRSPKNQNPPQLKPKYLSRQVTPRESLLLPNEAGLKALKQQGQGSNSAQVCNLRGVKSEKKSKGQRQGKKKQEAAGKVGIQVSREAAVLSQKKLWRERTVAEWLLLKQELQQQRRRNEVLLQLLRLEEQKSREGSSYIELLEYSLERVLATDTAKHHVASITSFKAIEQKDEIIMFNEQLQHDLEREKLKADAISLQLQQIKQNLDHALEKLALAQAQLRKEAHQQQALDRKENNKELQPGSILLSSRCIQAQCYPDNKRLKEEKDRIVAEIDQLQAKLQALRQSMAKLQIDKLHLKKQIDRYREQSKKQIQIPTRQPKKQENVKKNEKASKQKIFKSPPLRYSNKHLANTPAIHAQNLKTQQQVSIGSADKNTKVSTQTQSKAQQEQSLGKSLDGVFNQVKSEVNAQVKAQVNQTAYYANTFQGQISYF